MQDAGLILPPHGGTPIALPNTTGAIKARPSDTAGGYALIEFTMAPGPIAGPPAHTHPHTEAFYVLEGMMDFLVGERRVRVEPGGFAIVPGGVAHTFANMGAGPARFLTLFSPGEFVGYFEELTALFAASPGAPPDMEKVGAIAARYGQAFAGPPLTVGAP